LAATASAALLYQSAATLHTGPSNSIGGVGVDPTFFSGVNFQVTTPVHVDDIGGHFGNFAVAGNNQVFGAIMPVSSISSVPTPSDLSSNVLATTLITLPAAGTSNNASGPMSLNLSPGFYAVIFGSGKFGATSNFAVAATSRDDGAANTGGVTTYALRQSDGAFFTQAPGARYFVDGTVPEPGSATALLVLTSASIIRRRRN
jgi:hypothetical protein